LALKLPPLSHFSSSEKASRLFEAGNLQRMKFYDEQQS
jgi:hypothetical protein